jgi:hypothetical protein
MHFRDMTGPGSSVACADLGGKHSVAIGADRSHRQIVSGLEMNAGMTNSSCNPVELLERSTLYREFLAEREEILRHKWCESERAGRDIGFDCALISWVIRHRSQWRKSRRGPASIPPSAPL